MRDENTEEELVFYLNCWLAEDEGDKCLMKEIAVSNKPALGPLPGMYERFYSFTDMLLCHFIVSSNIVEAKNYCSLLFG